MKSLTMDNVRTRALAHIRRDLTLNALDDIVPSSAVAQEVRERLAPAADEEAFALALDLLRDLIGAGMIEVVDLVDGKLVRWPTSINETLDRLRIVLPTLEADYKVYLKATERAATWLTHYDKVLSELTQRQE